MACPFCDRKSLEDRIITETKNFLFIGSVGQIVEGYSLFVPKKHVLCFGMLSDKLIDEYLELKDKVDKAVTSAYQKPMYFEHGIVGQTVPHAHMHCVPSNRDLLPALMLRNYSIKANRKINSEKELKQVIHDFGPYYFYEFNGLKMAFDVNSHEMALRMAVANTFGMPELADWKNVNQEEDRKTRQKAVDKLKVFF
ncbi:MAG: HIT domain-containing protein [Candidatus Nanoarchaeia archaeon]|jgi:diadenosine tetraphosphate (Ap4A) HIT family hydrolase